jgi:hypothetical protein
MRLKGQKHTTGAVLFIFIMVTFGFSRAQREDRPELFNQETGTFVKVD